MKGYAPGWQMRCRKCNWTVDAAEAGIIRIAAAGTCYKLRWCPQCRRLRWVAVEKKNSQKAPPQTALDTGIKD